MSNLRKICWDDLAEAEYPNMEWEDPEFGNLSTAHCIVFPEEATEEILDQVAAYYRMMAWKMIKAYRV